MQYFDYSKGNRGDIYTDVDYESNFIHIFRGGGLNNSRTKSYAPVASIAQVFPTGWVKRSIFDRYAKRDHSRLLYNIHVTVFRLCFPFVTADKHWGTAFRQKERRTLLTSYLKLVKRSTSKKKVVYDVVSYVDCVSMQFKKYIL